MVADGGVCAGEGSGVCAGEGRHSRGGKPKKKFTENLKQLKGLCEARSSTGRMKGTCSQDAWMLRDSQRRSLMIDSSGNQTKSDLRVIDQKVMYKSSNIWKGT